MTAANSNVEVLPFDAPVATVAQGAAPKAKKAPKVSDDLKATIADAVSAGIQAGLAAFAQIQQARPVQAAPAPQTRAFPFQGAPARQTRAPRQQAPKAAAPKQGRPPVDPNRPRSVSAAAFAKAQQDAAKAAGHDALTVRTVYKSAYNEALAAEGLPKRFLDV